MSDDKLQLVRQVVSKLSREEMVAFIRHVIDLYKETIHTSCEGCVIGGPHHPYTTCDDCPIFDISEVTKTGDPTKVRLVRLKNYVPRV